MAETATFISAFDGSAWCQTAPVVVPARLSSSLRRRDHPTTSVDAATAERIGLVNRVAD
jgi:hypothetical protein